MASPSPGFQSSPAIGAGSITLRLPSHTLEAGEAMDIELVCTNTQSPEAPTVKAPPGLTVIVTNRTPSYSQQITTIQGRTTQRTEHVFLLRLLALKAGTYQLGPISVRDGGEVYRTKPVTIVVRETTPDTAARGDKLLFVELQVNPTSVYVTQSFTAKLRIGIRKVRINGRSFDLNLFRDVLVQRDSEFSVFPGAPSTLRTMWLADSGGARHQYEILDITKEIRAEQVGSVSIGPIFIKANYPTSLKRGWFGRYEVSSATKETDRAQAILVNVKNPPLDGRPEDYTGAIGRFSMTASAKPAEVEQGRPVTLTISIQGAPIGGVAGPDLARHPELTSRFDFTKEEMIGEVERGTKVFRRAIFPKQPGQQTVPPITWSYFDPNKEHYVTLSSKPITIAVHASSSKSTLADGESPASEQPHTTTLTLLSGGLSPNYVDADAVLVSQTLTFTTASIVALAAGPAGWFIITLLHRKRKRLRADAAWARHRRARKEALGRIAKALKKREGREQILGLASALTAYLSNRLNLPPAHVTPAEIRDALSRCNADKAILEDVITFLETCEAANYAPTSFDSIVPGQAGERVRNWIGIIERASR